jgi:hypothetical protein
MLDIVSKDGSWCNDVVNLDNILDVCAFKVNDLCVDC